MSSVKSVLLHSVIFLQILLIVTANTGERRRLCGQRLTEALQTLCRSRYASQMMTEKRSEDYAYLSDEPLAESSPFSYESMPFLANFGSAAAALRAPRVQRDTSYYLRRGGVVDECCRKPCTEQQLKSYCY